MDFDTQLMIAFAVFCIIGIPTLLYVYKRYRKMGKSIKYLEAKIGLAVAVPIFLILLLLRDDLSWREKISLIILAMVGMVAYVYGINFARKAFRKIMGLPPEDEHTGEVIKEKKKEE